MSVASGPNVVTSGLVFEYDMNNSRSWQGMPLTNNYPIPTPDGSNNVSFPVQGSGTFQRIYSGTYGGYTITSNDVVYRMDLVASGGCWYHGGSASISAGVYPTFTFDYYVSPDAADYCSNSSYLANMENYGGGAQGVGVYAPNTNKGVWQTVTFSGGQTGSSGTQAMFLYPGGCGGWLASSGYILYKNPQVIFSATNGMVAPFVGPTGTRSNTQALLDLTQNNIITCNNLTYASNNTFSLNGSSSDIRTPLFTSASGNVTMTGWFYVNLGTTGTFLSNGDDPGGYCIGIGQYFSSTDNQVCALFGYIRWILTGVYYQYTGWHMITMSLDSSGTPYIYINGNLIGSYPGTMANNPSAGTGFCVGSQWGIRYANTKPSNVGFYNRKLTDAEVLQNFNAQRSIYGI